MHANRAIQELTRHSASQAHLSAKYFWSRCYSFSMLPEIEFSSKEFAVILHALVAVAI